MHLTLIRDYVDAGVTLGTLTTDGLSLQTLELPWEPGPPPSRCGRPDRSCVPAGDYVLALHNTPAHPKTFALVNPTLGVYHEIADAPTGCGIIRTAVLLHVANFARELEGCIGVGRSRLKQPNGSWAIQQSLLAFGDLRGAVPWVDGNTITIAYANAVSPIPLS